MRALRALCCAVAITACFAPGVRGDEYNKQTFLTFSGPVQLPGITLAEGTYMFKLADPESGRRTLQVWDKEGTKLYTTLLTIPDRRLDPSDQPVVMFSERPSGEPQAIRAWFYPGDTTGQEFVYPKNQAVKIAKASNERVLSFEDDDARDAAQLHSAKVGRMDGSGTLAENTAADAPQTASATTSGAASTTADNTAQDVASSVRDNDRPVGTSGTTQPDARAQQAARGANAAAPAQGTSGSPQAAGAERRELPRTASAMGLVRMFAALSMIAAFAVRKLRTRHADAH